MSLSELLAAASSSHGFVTAQRAHELLITRDQLRSWCKQGVLRSRGRGCFTVVGAPPTWEQAVLLGTHSSGPLAFPSHRTAAAVWTLEGSRRGAIEVLVPKGAGWRQGTARLHETRHLVGADLDQRGLLRVTSIERTIIDNARFAPEERLREFLDDAVRRKLTTYDRVASRLLEMPTRGRKGVPTLRELLEPPERRPAMFYRGYDVLDRVNVGFISTVPSEGGRAFFQYDTTVPGNGNGGHEYGTTLPDTEKRAIVEYLKAF